MIPIPGASPSWHDIEIFALAVNVYERVGSTDKVNRIGDRVEKKYDKIETFPGSIDDQRTSLLLGQRRAQWDWESEGDAKTMDYLRALLLTLDDETSGTAKGPGDE